MNHFYSAASVQETIFTNARLVLPGAVAWGSLVVRGGLIAEVQPGRSALRGARDLGGDLLLPGLVDLHTDNLERQVQPRAGARWPMRPAMLAHDAHCASAGVTTVLDALCLGDLGFEADRVRTFRDGVAALDALAGTGLLRAEHFLHLRCELPAADMLALFDGVAEHARVRLVSLMDHSPGVGQYADLDRWRAVCRRDGLSPAAIEARLAELVAQRARLAGPNRRALLARLAGRGVVLASHDDRSAAEVACNHAEGIGVAEFPVTLAAAQAARARGMAVIAGAPNLVRGGSHSGNVAAAALIAAGAVDALASDYVPASLLEAAFCEAGAAEEEPGAAPGPGLARAVARVSDAPARIARLADRGRLAAGLRADLLRVHPHSSGPILRETWLQGSRVA